MAAAHPGIVKRACALDGMEVRTTAGERLGHVFDLRMRTAAGGAPEVTALVYGSSGLLERLGLRHREPSSIPWSRVRAIEDGAIVVDEQPARRRT